MEEKAKVGSLTMSIYQTIVSNLTNKVHSLYTGFISSELFLLFNFSLADGKITISEYPKYVNSA